MKKYIFREQCIMSDDKINVVGTNIREKATVIWNVANHLFGYFKPQQR